MHRLISKLALAGPVTALVVMLTATVADAQNTRTINGGRTTIILDQSFVSALGTLGLLLGTVSPTVFGNSKLTFPIAAGAIDVNSARTEILHSGGITLTAGGTQAKLESFIIDTTGPHPFLTGMVIVNKTLVGRLPLFNFQFPSGLTLPLSYSGDVIHFPSIGVTLTDTAAYTLDGIFNIAIQPNTTVGTARVEALLSIN